MLGMLLVLFGAISYGVLSTIVTFAYRDGFSPNQVVVSQLLFATILLWTIHFLQKGKKTSQKNWWKLLGVGLTVGFTSIFYYGSLQYISASIAIVLLFQFTWIGILIDAVVRRTLPKKDKVVSVIFLVIGTLLAGGVLESELHLSFIGVVLGLLSAVSYSLFILFSGNVSLDVNPWTRSAIAMTGALVIGSIVFPPNAFFFQVIVDGMFKWGVLLALFVVISTVCFTIGAPKIDAGLAIILSSAELPTAVFMSYYVLNESIKPLRWLGVAVILVGIAIPELYRRLGKLPARQ